MAVPGIKKPFGICRYGWLRNEESFQAIIYVK
jgi:hypothetical protein